MPTELVPFRDALRVWVRVALQSFGGPAGQISVRHRILVDEKRWIDEPRFLHALNYCMLLPGPEAQQLATYIGWLLHGTAGGLAAGILFVLPGFFAILGLSLLYVGFHGSALVAALLWGLKPAVIAIVLGAVLRIGRRALGGPYRVTLAVASFLAIFLFAVPFPAIVLVAAFLGWLGGRFASRPAPEEAEQGSETGETGEQTQAPHTRRRRAMRSLRVAAIGLALWFVPLGLLALYFGRGHVLVQMGLFFSRAAVVTFGGAYAVLAYVGQQAVETFGWLRPGEMLDGLGMAETTPGPLIMVLQFVGFLGAYRHPGTLAPMTAGLLGALVTVWVTFVPCFLWIFLGAPYVEILRRQRGLSNALAAITAAVVGVIANLAVWFSLHTLFGRLDTIHKGAFRLLVPGAVSSVPTSRLSAVGGFPRMRIALLGTGLMGYAMAERLLEQGVELSVWNRTRAKAEPLGAQGAQVADSAREAIEAAGEGGVVLAMLRDAPAIRAALDGALPSFSGKTFVQMSTIAPGESRALGLEIEAAGAKYLEAPVLGSTPQARAGTMQVLVGGDAELFARVEKTLGLLGPPTLVGPVGQAAALKLALNQLIPNLIAAFSLSLGMVRRSGVDLDLFLGILRKSALYAPSFDGKLPKIRIRDFAQPSFPAELMLKDLDLIRAECETLGLDATVADAVRDVLVRTVENGQGGADYSALYEVIDPRD